MEGISTEVATIKSGAHKEAQSGLRTQAHSESKGMDVYTNRDNKFLLTATRENTRKPQRKQLDLRCTAVTCRYEAKAAIKLDVTF